MMISIVNILNFIEKPTKQKAKEFLKIKDFLGIAVYFYLKQKPY